jgi:DNA-binding winged helix-turn-helix (wHTH) protein
VAAKTFGVFTADLTTGELFKQGRRVRLQQQPFEMLRILLERPGELVTREALRSRLWPGGVTVDFDQSLNKCVTKLRDALGDQAASPRFIETLPKRGYRFVAPVAAPGACPKGERCPDSDRTLDGEDAQVASEAQAPPPPMPGHAAPGLWPMTGVLGLLFALAISISVGWHDVRASGAPTRAARGLKAHTRSPIHAAKDAAARGRAALARRSPDSVKLAVEHFSRAILLSPRYADAYAGLADAYIVLAAEGHREAPAAIARARAAAQRALTLDAQLAEGHAALGLIAGAFDGNAPAAEAHFARALELEPGNSIVHEWFAAYLSAQGRHEAAADAARRAVAAEPLSLSANAMLGRVLHRAGRIDESAAQLARTLEIDPEFLPARHGQCGRVLSAQC